MSLKTGYRYKYWTRRSENWNQAIKDLAFVLTEEPAVLKMVWQANGRRLSVENFDRENVDELIKIRQYFPPSKICAIWYICIF